MKRLATATLVVVVTVNGTVPVPATATALGSAPNRVPLIDTIDSARAAHAGYIEALRQRKHARPFDLTDDVYDALLTSGELDAWAAEEARTADETGAYIDPADCDDSDEIERWFDCGHDSQWLDANADDVCEFMLGAPVAWAANGHAKGTLFVNAPRAAGRKSPFPAFTVPIAVDSGGFTQITTHGRYTQTPEDYVRVVRRLCAAGHVKWAAIQDWMVERKALLKTGLTVEQHQRRTVASFLRLRELAPDVRWLPVIQGQYLEDYLRHIEMFAEAGVDLTRIERVGIGSVCRRQAARQIVHIVRGLAGRGIRFHLFGVKAEALRQLARLARSADSYAWSYRGRNLSYRTGFRDSVGRTLNNSPEFAEQWRDKNHAAIAAAERDATEQSVVHEIVFRVAQRMKRSLAPDTVDLKQAGERAQSARGARRLRTSR